MATAEMSFLQNQLEERKRRLESAITLAPDNANVEALLREVDSALDRFASGTYGLCDACHDTIERDRLLADPLIRYCLARHSPCCASAIVSACLEDLRAFAGSNPGTDDLTLLAIRHAA